MIQASELTLALTPLDRVESVQGAFGRSRSGAWWPTAVIILMIAAAAAFLAVIIAGRLREVWRRRAFRNEADKAGVTEEERRLLGHLASLAGLKHAHQLLATPEAFERGAEALMSSDRVTAMDADLQAQTRAMVDTLRGKLGLASKRRQGTPAVAISLSRIPAGTMVEVVRESAPETLTAVVAGEGQADESQAEEGQAEEGQAEEGQADEHVVLELLADLEPSPGESWTVRHVEGGLLWEFDAKVVRLDPSGNVVLLPGGSTRCTNRRHFIRTPIRAAARVAPFPFLCGEKRPGAPMFVPATLVEIAGPGLKLEAPVQLEMGDRALVTLTLDGGEAVQALGVARRPTVEHEGVRQLMVELIGLTDPEVAELVRITNAAVRAARSAPAQPDVEDAAAPPRPGRQEQAVTAQEG